MVTRREFGLALVAASGANKPAGSEELTAGWSSLWIPPERLTLSQWAERNFYLSPEYSGRTGPLKLFGWQREPFDAFTDPTVEQIVVMAGTQLLKTILIQAALAYIIAEQPGPVLLSQYKDDDAKSFSKERLAPMIRDCPLLRGKIAEPRNRDGSNTIEYKEFPGGQLSLVGSQSPSNFARRSIRYYFGDEIDRYPQSTGKEGDGISLAYERTVTYGSRKKIILCCSPTVAGQSRIAKAYGGSDQRRPWVPCPHCGELQTLKWEQVQWDNSLPVDERPTTAQYICKSCGAGWNDLQRWKSCELAEWRPGAAFGGIAGFWISHLYSPWKTMGEIVAKHLAAKSDPEQLKVWVNTTLAELWEERGEAPD